MQLCATAVVPPNPKVDYQIKETCIEYISLIKDAVNSILAQITPPPFISCQAYFEGLSILVNPIERLKVIINIDTGE